MTLPRWWMFSYDVGDPRRLRRLANQAQDLGERVQKSLFMLGLTHDDTVALCREIDTLHHPTQDRIMLRPVCSTCRAATVVQGMGGHPEREWPYWIV